MVTRYTGELSQPPVVEMSREKNSKKKPKVHNIFCFLDNFIRHTGPMVTMGHQVHRWAISARIDYRIDCRIDYGIDYGIENGIDYRIDFRIEFLVSLRKSIHNSHFILNSF